MLYFDLHVRKLYKVITNEWFSSRRGQKRSIQNKIGLRRNTIPDILNVSRSRRRTCAESACISWLWVWISERASKRFRLSDWRWDRKLDTRFKMDCAGLLNKGRNWPERKSTSSFRQQLTQTIIRDRWTGIIIKQMSREERVVNRKWWKVLLKKLLICIQRNQRCTLKHFHGGIIWRFENTNFLLEKSAWRKAFSVCEGTVNAALSDAYSVS